MTLIAVPGGPERRVGDRGGDLPQPEDRLRHPGQLQVDSCTDSTDKTGFIECKCTVHVLQVPTGPVACPVHL